MRKHNNLNKVLICLSKFKGRIIKIFDHIMALSHYYLYEIIFHHVLPSSQTCCQVKKPFKVSRYHLMNKHTIVGTKVWQ
jgi:hypothetical protein